MGGAGGSLVLLGGGESPQTCPPPFLLPATGSSREKKELQKILDRKRHNSISEAKTREKNKKES